MLKKMATKISISNLLKVSMSTYLGNLDDSEGIYDGYQQDLIDIQNEDKKVRCKMIDGSERMISRIHIVNDFNIDWGIFSAELISRCQKDIDGSIKIESKGYKNISELLATYGIKFDGYEFYRPKYYNNEDDSLDIRIELEDMEWSLEKYGLTELVQKYIDEVRMKNRDGYQSFEPDKIEDVIWSDYCVMRAILQKEGVYDFISSELQALVDCEGFEIYDNSIGDYHFEYQDEINNHRYYFILHYDEGYLEEIEQNNFLLYNKK